MKHACMASVPLDLWLPFQQQRIIVPWLMTNWTARWPRHMGVNNLPESCYSIVKIKPPSSHVPHVKHVQTAELLLYLNYCYKPKIKLQVLSCNLSRCFPTTISVSGTMFSWRRLSSKLISRRPLTGKPSNQHQQILNSVCNCICLYLWQL